VQRRRNAAAIRPLFENTQPDVNHAEPFSTFAFLSLGHDITFCRKQAHRPPLRHHTPRMPPCLPFVNHRRPAHDIARPFHHARSVICATIRITPSIARTLTPVDAARPSFQAENTREKVAASFVFHSRTRILSARYEENVAPFGVVIVPPRSIKHNAAPAVTRSEPETRSSHERQASLRDRSRIMLIKPFSRSAAVAEHVPP